LGILLLSGVATRQSISLKKWGAHAPHSFLKEQGYGKENFFGRKIPMHKKCDNDSPHKLGMTCPVICRSYQCFSNIQQGAPHDILPDDTTG
jgi:hypothetical protein